MVRSAFARSSALSFERAFSIGVNGIAGWKVEQACAGSLDRVANTISLVGRQVVHDDDVAGREGGNQ